MAMVVLLFFSWIYNTRVLRTGISVVESIRVLFSLSLPNVAFSSSLYLSLALSYTLFPAMWVTDDDNNDDQKIMRRLTTDVVSSCVYPVI